MFTPVWDCIAVVGPVCVCTRSTCVIRFTSVLSAKCCATPPVPSAVPPRWPSGLGVHLETGRSLVRIPLAPGFFQGRVIPVLS